jgi:hypothetical protein
MTITTLDGLVSALGNNNSRLIVEKASLSNQVVGRLCSLWRATGTPGQGAIPGTTPARCDMGLTGSPSFTAQTSPATSYFSEFRGVSPNGSLNLEFYDRLAHMGGLVLNSTSSQVINSTSGFDLDLLSIPAARRGASGYTDVRWFLEVYTDGGATASNATINVTFTDNSSADLAVQAVGGTIRVGHMFPLDPLIQAADQGKVIRRINSVILSASTTGAGNFGFTAVRPLGALPLFVANRFEQFDWATGGNPEIPNNTCLMLAVLLSTGSTTGIIRGFGKFTHG